MIRFYNGKLLSFSGGFEISDWEVWVEESMILYVGPAIDTTKAFNQHRCLYRYYGVLDQISSDYPPVSGRLHTRYAPVRRSPP